MPQITQLVSGRGNRDDSLGLRPTEFQQPEVLSKKVTEPRCLGVRDQRGRKEIRLEEPGIREDPVRPWPTTSSGAERTIRRGLRLPIGFGHMMYSQ